ncbi:MAG: DUF3857 domain-containing protein [Sphingobacteriaceae bacterium]|nr:MAG: DUF3857 domain-containing protein [Sphingobacteriaceae bacterium]
MIKTYTSAVLLLLLFKVCKAQTAQPNVLLQAFGKINQADLDMKQCDFEKDANAMVLFDSANIFFDTDYKIVMERHKRIKIFNSKGTDEANIRVEYYGGNKLESIYSVQAETINDNGGKPEFIKIDHKNIYTENIDKNKTALVFSFPQVKPGSVIEFKYRWTANSVSDFPDWYFQSSLPVRYSQLATTIPDELYYKNLVSVKHPFIKNTPEIKAMANVPSLSDEPFMSSRGDNLDRILFQLSLIKPHTGFVKTIVDNWQKVGENYITDEDYGGQINRKLSGEELIVKEAKALKNDEAKLAYLYEQVKKNMKWNQVDRTYSSDGTVKAWEKKTGNSTDINLILCHFLKQTGINAMPMLVSTRSNGKINPAYPNAYQFNRTVVYIPVDTAKFYLLDATNQYNCYKQIPANLLNSYGLYMNKAKHQSDIVFLKEDVSTLHQVNISAELAANGSMQGIALIRSYDYERAKRVNTYRSDGEKEFINFLKNDDRNLRLDSLKFENIENDTLPLVQRLKFKVEPTSSDDQYIYFSPNLFGNLSKNPFLNETRNTDIDFGFLRNCNINGVFRLPAGYKTDALPASINYTMPDHSIVFKRFVEQQDNQIAVRYNITFSKSVYFKEDYELIFAFYKKLYEMLNEQIVLKKV